MVSPPAAQRSLLTLSGEARFVPEFVPFPPCRGIYAWDVNPAVHAKRKPAVEPLLYRPPLHVPMGVLPPAAARTRIADRRADSIALSLASVLDIVPVRAPTAPQAHARRALPPDYRPPGAYVRASEVVTPGQASVSLLQYGPTGGLWCATDAEHGWCLVSQKYVRPRLPVEPSLPQPLLTH